MRSSTSVDRNVVPGSATETPDTATLMRAFHQAMPVGLIILGLDLRIRHINPTIVEETGCALEASIGKTLEFLLGDRASKAVQLARLAISTREPQKLDAYISDTLKFWAVGGLPLFHAGALVGVGLTFTDATERKRVEVEIRESEERYRALIESMPDAVIVHRSRVIVFANQAAADLLGVDTHASLLGRRVLEFVAPSEHAAIEAQMREFVWRGEAVLTELQIGVDAQGRARWGEARAKVVQFERSPAIQVIIRDITSRRRLGEMLEELVSQRTAELREANRDLESFSYSVSHDLRAPLRHISGHANLLLERDAVTADPEAQRHAENVMKAAARLSRLVDDLLNFSRTSRAELRRAAVHMPSLVTEVRREFEVDTRTRTIRWRIGSLPDATCDATLMKQVWQNLIANAIKYTGTREEAQIEIGGDERQGEIVYHIKDNGVGFDPRYAAKLFGVFERLHSPNEFEGTGIGLAIVHRIIERHHGRIWAESQLNAGATFWFALPRA